MSGETGAFVSGWTTDTLREYMITLLTTRHELFETKIVAVQDQLERQLHDLHVLMDERHATAVKALDEALAGQHASMTTAMVAAEKAVDAALVSTEKAVAKAEAAADKRFDSVNGFRAQLTEQARTFVTRNEMDSRFNAMTDKIDTHMHDADKRFAEINARIDLNTGAIAGRQALKDTNRQQNNLLIAGAGLIVAIVVAAITVLALMGK